MPGLTPNQERAVAADGNVLVIAGAGTGKTRTLVERCLNRILSPEDPVSLDELLVVTFTDAAATEMRQRLRLRLDEELARCPGDLRLAEQAALTETAAISTLHSFCLRLVREHVHELGLDPQLVVLESSQAIILARRTLEAVLRHHYAGSTDADLAVQELVVTHSGGQEDQVCRLILQLHEYAQTLPDPVGWLTAQQATYIGPLPQSWETWLVEALGPWRQEWIQALDEAPADNARAAECRQLLSNVSPHAGRREWADALPQLLALDGGWPPRKKTAWRAPLARLFQEAVFLSSVAAQGPPKGRVAGPPPAGVDRGVDGEVLDGSPGTAPAALETGTEDPWRADPLNEDWNWSRPPMQALLGLAAEFHRAFTSAKRELAALDFHDLEQLALRLLWDSHTDAPTPLARRWRERLRLVFVDEYQDINAAQDCILRALSREGPNANRFLVGDVKQSIYRFRLANPRIFQQYAETWAKPDQGNSGTVIPLNENFRSRPAILEFVNELFAPLMHRDLGGVAYDDEARLRAGTRHPVPTGAPDDAPAVEFLLRLTSPGPQPEARGGGGGAGGHPPENEREDDDEGPEGRSAAEQEAALVANRLHALKALPLMIWDEAQGQRRPVAWRDMAVLLRAPTRRSETFARIFAAAGVPLWVKRTGLYQATEISDLLSLLQLLDNPVQDIPLLAVLRSPLVGLSLDELAVVRLALRGEPIWTALARFHQTCQEPATPGGARLPPSHRSQDNDLSRQQPRPTALTSAASDPQLEGASREFSAGADPLLTARASAWPKVHQFLDRFVRWRELTRVGSLSQCLETILDETGYEEAVRAQPRGPQRVANLERLLTIARDFDRLQRQGLFRFLRFIAEQQEVEFDPEPAQVEAADAVSLMSIHQSKGLEFPVVVVADLGKRFNLHDLTASVILDEVYGLAPLVRPPDQPRAYPSLPHWLAARRRRREALGEELRLLYVAFTRAREKLCLVGTASRTRAEADWAAPRATFTTFRLLGATTALDWLAPRLPHLTGSANWLEQSRGSSRFLGWRIVAGPEDIALPAPDTSVTPAEGAASSGEALRSEGEPWAYPHSAATREAAKASVTSLRRRALELEESALWFPAASLGPDGAGVPGRSDQVLSAADRGTVHHRALECVPLEALQSGASLAAAVEQLYRAGQFTEAERGALDLEALAAFGQSDLGHRVRAQATLVRRELEFTARLSPADFRQLELPCTPGLAEDEFVVVQGVVDLAVIGPDSLWLVDFKTDAVTDTTLAEKARAYRPQLRLYALALERLFRRPATEAWLHFLALNRSVPVALTGAPCVSSDMSDSTSP